VALLAATAHRDWSVGLPLAANAFDTHPYTSTFTGLIASEISLGTMPFPNRKRAVGRGVDGWAWALKARRWE
jgi:hypothetical protein